MSKRYEQAICKRENVTGKSQIWQHVGSVSLTFASRYFCSLKGYCLYIMACLEEPCPYAWMLNQSAFVQGNIWTLSTCGWLQERIINTSPPRDWPFQGIFATSLPSSQSAGFLNKLVFLASTPCLWVIGLSCGKQSEFGLGNKNTRKETQSLYYEKCTLK